MKTLMLSSLLILMSSTYVLADGGINPLRLTDDQGAPLYTFDKDTDGVSNCTGQCAVIWPPVAAPAGALDYDLSVVVRVDGTRQLARQKQPLYTFIQDNKGSLGTGDNVNGFHIARP